LEFYLLSYFCFSFGKNIYFGNPLKTGIGNMTKLVLYTITFFLKMVEKLSNKDNPFRCRQKVRTSLEHLLLKKQRLRSREYRGDRIENL
jgi:hypothetical protein